MSKTKPIPFRLAHIQTEEFATLESNLIDKEEAGIKASLNFAINAQSHFVKCLFKVEINLDAPIVVLEVACEFEIEEKAWSDFINSSKNQINIPRDLVQHLSLITIGTARGVLHAKTTDKPLNKYFLPLVNVTEMIQDDLVFEIKDA